MNSLVITIKKDGKDVCDIVAAGTETEGEFSISNNIHVMGHNSASIKCGTISIKPAEKETEFALRILQRVTKTGK